VEIYLMKLKTTTASLVFALLVTSGCVDRIHTTPDASPSNEAGASDLSVQPGVDAGKETTTPAVDAVTFSDAAAVPDALVADVVLSQDAAAAVVADVGGGVDSQPTDVRVAPDAAADVAVTVSDGSVDVAIDVPADSPAPTPDGSAGACQANSDCPGTCQMCNASHACIAAVSQDDPNARCAGTCDATGACKSKKGQTCQVTTDCAGGLPCADGYCCDRACTGSCEACNVATSLGTCTTLAANAVPHASHATCVATDATCAGYCNGSSAACFYPSSACGTASCTGNTSQAAGTCSNGACAKPAAQTCTNGNTCQASTGTCICSNTTCGTSCVNLATDSNNCGSCGHDCLGGTCSGSQCQAAVVASGATYVIGVDASASGNVYFQGTDTETGLTNAYQVGKTALGGTGSPLDLGGSSVEYLGVIGAKLFFDLEGEFEMCSFSNTAPNQCSATTNNLPDSPYGNLVPFKSPSPLYIAIYDVLSGPNSTIAWYSASGTQVQTFTIYGSTGSPGSFFAFGDSVYWIQDASDSTASTPDSAVYSVSATAANPTATRLTASVPPATYKIIDANALSLLFSGPSGLYRVALPNGDAAHAPQLLVSPASSSGSVTTATEDAHGVYWFENDGTLFTCSPASCGGTKKALASGQALVGATNTVWPQPLYQDSSALYWGNYSTGQVMRLVK